MKEVMRDYEWGHLDAIVGTKIRSLPLSSSGRPSRQRVSESCFYVVSIIGVGSTSNPWVIKMYVKSTNDEDGLDLDAKAFKKIAKAKTEKEVKNFHTLYQFLFGKVSRKKIIGFGCVIMPFFKPLSKTDRKSKEPEIKQVLRERFFRKGLQYHEVDLRWRHVGLYKDEEGDEHVVLFDLADLQVFRRDSVREDHFVEKQWKLLEKRLDNGNPMVSLGHAPGTGNM